MSPLDLSAPNHQPNRFSQFCFLGVRVLVAGVFFWAGWAKIIDPVGFSNGVAAFQLFPEGSINLLAGTVPVVELFVAVLLFWRPWSRRAALLSGILALSFAFLFVWAWWQGLNVQCACFGNQSGSVSPLLGILRAAGLLAGCVWLYLRMLAEDVGSRGWPGESLNLERRA